MNVFISYRRQDNIYLAAQLRDELAMRLGEDRVFFDVDSIPVGVDFVEHIRASIARSSVVLALMGQNWRPEELANEADFVRIELLCARELQTMIIPVLHSKQVMPGRDEIPAALEWLVRLNAFSIGTPPDHRDDLRRLVDLVVDLDPDARTAGEAASSTLGTAPPVSVFSRRGSLDFISERDRPATVPKRTRRSLGGEAS